ncbi:MAG: hypothetical protein Q4A12_01825 [Eubacteriales bacterium]|nr:hypothetical protein [Eubacteriales bacterium]
MAFIIGFTASDEKETNKNKVVSSQNTQLPPRKSLVDVHFVENNCTLTYYNDEFYLHCGDMVYVDGKLEGVRGRVVSVNYNFKIKISDYKRVVAVVDTNVSGKLYIAGSHFLSFERDVINMEKVCQWFMPPKNDDEPFVSGSDGRAFRLDDLGDMDVSTLVAQRGHDYYMQNRVRYICIDGAKGYAIVEGSEVYEVEFCFNNGEISELVCSCFCSYNCKHEFASMLQLKETLEFISKHYADEYKRTGYFAAINKGTLFYFAVDTKETGTFTI